MLSVKSVNYINTAITPELAIFQLVRQYVIDCELCRIRQKHLDHCGVKKSFISTQERLLPLLYLSVSLSILKRIGGME